MSHWKKRFPSEHLEAADLDGKTVTIRIDAVESYKVKDDQSGADKPKGLIRFAGKVKQTWVYPVSVGACLAAMFGDDDAAWVGKRVTIQAQRVEAFGEMVDAVRPVGSPDIARPVSFKVRIGRKRVPMTMTPTGAPKQSDATPPAATENA